VNYSEDLAYIHHAGYGGLARAAAEQLTTELKRVSLTGGLVVELGCGSGILAGRLSEAGYAVVGIDVSDAMLAIARAHVPYGNFRTGSFVTFDPPRCVAIAAIGEVFNYVFDEANNAQTRHQFFERAFNALTLNGLLLFDVAGFDRPGAETPKRTFGEGEDWTVLVETDLDETHKILIRRITSFRKVGTMYRRDAETHRLQLIDPAEILESLVSVGFRAVTLTQYGTEPLPHGVVGFQARKPQEAT
jgi:SAM-dependent methyltransferase